MAYKAYVTPKYYLETYRGTSIPKSELDLRLRDASRHINSLTYSRIVGQGFSALTEFQQDVIREVVCRQADFEAENREALDCALSSYSINGVSMTLTAGWNVFLDKGVAMPRELYSLLEQTGLTFRGIGR